MRLGVMSINALRAVLPSMESSAQREHVDAGRASEPSRRTITYEYRCTCRSLSCARRNDVQ